MKKAFTFLTILAASAQNMFAQVQNGFNYATAATEANKTGLTKYITGFGGTFLLLMLAGGIIGGAWIAVELMLFDKELRDCKKGLIGASILTIAPAMIFAAVKTIGKVT